MSSPADLSIIIVNWNTRDLLAECLRSVVSSQLSVVSGQSSVVSRQSSITDNCQLTTEIFVVDNASTDDSAAMVRGQFPWVRLIESPANLGFAGGNNLALRQARGRYLLLLNPDTVVTQGALDLLVAGMEASPQAAILGAQLLNADGSPQLSYGVFPSLWTELPLLNRLLRPVHASRRVQMLDKSMEIGDVDWVSGACLLIRRTVIDAIGPLDEDFWLYTEEADWCYRARQAGWDVLSAPAVKIYHLARAASRQRYVITMLHFYQSRVRFARKHYGPRHALMMMQLLRMKAAVWQRRPNRSPLHNAYPDLNEVEIGSAYRLLTEALSPPVESFLKATW